MNRGLGTIGLSAVVIAIVAPLLKIAEFVLLPPARRPDLLMVLAIAVGWIGEPWASAPVGFGIGLMEDVLVGRALGVRAATLAACAGLASAGKKALNPEPVVSRCLIAFLVSGFGDLLSYGLLRMLGFSISPSVLVSHVLPWTSVWSAALAVPFYPILRRVWGAAARCWPDAVEEARRLPL